MKNKSLRFFTGIMCAAMLLGSTITAMAEVTETQTVNQDEAEGGTTRDVEVLYEQDSTFTVTIPKTIVLDETKTSDYEVNVTGDISSDKQVSVTPQDTIDDVDGVNFYMQDQSGATITKEDVAATVTQDVTVWSSNDVAVENGTTQNGNVSATDLSSGSWKGTFTFDIALEDVQ